MSGGDASPLFRTSLLPAILTVWSNLPRADARRTREESDMAMVRAGLIQMALKADTGDSPQAIRARMNEAHLPLIEEAGRKCVQVLCLQEVFNQPYFCPSKDAKWYAAAEKVPDGSTVSLKRGRASCRARECQYV